MSDDEEMIATLKAVIKAFFSKDTASMFARFARDMLDSLIEQGFTRMEALELVKVCLGWKNKN